MSDKLLIAQSRVLESDKPDVKLWFEIFKLISLGVSLVDRTEQIKFPYNFHNYFPMPTNLHGFNKTYAEVCVDRAKEFLELSKRLNKPILVLWSGGIDSTAVLVSFILAGATNQDVIVSLNNLSMREHFKFYHKFIRGKFDIISSEGMCDYITGKYIVVGGEHNDQLFGSDIIHRVYVTYGMDLVFEPATEENIKKVFQTRQMSEPSMKIWYDLLKNHSKCAPTEIKTVFDFFWWYNFAFKWQSVFFRLLTRVSVYNRNIINDEFVRSYYHQFFVTDDFQKWSILNPDKKIGKTWESYKLAAKEFIFDFDHDTDYFINKTKYGSLSRVFRHRQVPEGLTSDFKFIDKLDPEIFYLEQNTFS